MRIVEVQHNFMEHLTRLGYRKNTVAMLGSCVAEFLFQMKQKNIRHLSQLTPTDILAYHEYLKNRPNRRRGGGLSEQMISHHLYSLRVFFDWQLHTEALTVHPMSALQFARPKTKPYEILTVAEIKLLYQACETHLQRAVLGVYYGCGLRRNEGAALLLKDLHFAEGVLYVRSGKGARRRAVPMAPSVMEDFRRYLQHERKARPDVRHFLVNARGQALSAPGMLRMIRQPTQTTEIEKHITLHGLRQSIATHLLESGLKMEQVRDFLGLRFLESTQRYTRVSQNLLNQL